MGLDTSCSSSNKILVVVLDLLFLLAVGSNYTDGVEGLVSVAGTLPVGLHGLLGPLRDDLAHEGGREHEGREGSHDYEGVTPAFAESESQARERH